jgi:hypothetical protein
MEVPRLERAALNSAFHTLISTLEMNSLYVGQVQTSVVGEGPAGP